MIWMTVLMLFVMRYLRPSGTTSILSLLTKDTMSQRFHGPVAFVNSIYQRSCSVPHLCPYQKLRPDVGVVKAAKLWQR